MSQLMLDVRPTLLQRELGKIAALREYLALPEAAYREIVAARLGSVPEAFTVAQAGLVINELLSRVRNRITARPPAA